jgi:hypothetical protein
MGWCDTTEEQARYTLHSHVLLFIAQFDWLISLLWSDSEHIRRKAKEELTKYMEQTMSSTYQLLEKGAEHDDSIFLCRIIPSVVPDQTIRNMRHQRHCHMLKGVIAKCEGCNETFTSQKIIWNAVDNWVDKLHHQGVSIFPNFKQGLPLSKYQMDRAALRFSYDMEYYTRYPCEEVQRILKIIVLTQFNEHDYRHRKGCFKKTDECRFTFPEKDSDRQ